jgi:hypothetical protein
MTLTATATFDIEENVAASTTTTLIIQPAAAYGGSGNGRLEHPTLGTYDYAYSPDEVVDLDVGPLYRPTWARATTLSGSADTLWQGTLADAVVIERWRHGEGSVGAPITFVRQLWQFYANPPDPADTPVIWTPTYMSDTRYRVVLSSLRVGGERYTLDRRLLSYGYTPSPVELELRILGLAD